MNKLFTCFILCLLISTCKKETNIIEIENIADNDLYGTWELVNGDTNIAVDFYLFDKESKMSSYWYEGSKGYRYYYTTPFRASKNEIIIGGSQYKYFLNKNEFKLMENDSTFKLYKKNINITKIPDNWIKKVSILNSIEVPKLFYSRSVGIDGNFLYYCTNTRDSFVFKHNVITNKIEDSMPINSSRCSNFYYNGYLYHGDFDEGKLYKTLNFKINSKIYISNTIFNNVTALTMNPQTNDIYVKSEYNDVFKGKENNDFNKIEFGNYSNSLTYFKNNTFIISNDSEMVYILDLNNKVIENYKIDGYTIYNVSCNGSDIWVTAVKKNSDRRFLLKLQLP